MRRKRGLKVYPKNVEPLTAREKGADQRETWDLICKERDVPNIRRPSLSLEVRRSQQGLGRKGRCQKNQKDPADAFG